MLKPLKMAKLKECYYQTKQDQRKSSVQQMMQKSTDFLRRIIVSGEGQGGVILSCVCSYCHRFSLEDYNWLVSAWHGKTGQLVVRGVRRPVHLEWFEQNLGYAGRCIPVRQRCFGRMPCHHVRAKTSCAGSSTFGW